MLRKLSCHIFLLTACEFTDPDTHYTYQLPPTLPDGLIISAAATEGLDQALLENMTDLIVHETYKRLQSVLILKNGKLVYENYFNGYREEVLQNNYSAAKSYTSLLAGIAIDRGLIESVDVPVRSLLPEYADLQNPDTRKNNITLRHLLTMNTGIHCNDWSPQEPGEIAMRKTADWIQYTLDLPLVHDPGTNPSYCTGNAVILGRIIENSSHMPLEKFANDNLFHPLGITSLQWDRMPDGHASAGGLFYLRPRDMAKIGLVMLNGGAWNNTRIVSSSWVEESTKKQVDLNGYGYGYLWWHAGFSKNNQPVENYFAWGNGGQFIFILPSEQLVVVFTGGNMESELGLQAPRILQEHIIPAIK
jgi:CubicO group peptidase (beta-lactamase class C family)